MGLARKNAARKAGGKKKPSVSKPLGRFPLNQINSVNMTNKKSVNTKG